MEKQEALAILLLILIIFLGFGLDLVQASVLNVCNTCNSTDFTTIQDAINNASDRDIINVSAGTYNEQLIIDKSNLTIMSLRVDKSIVAFLDCGTDAFCIKIQGNNVTINGLRIYNNNPQGKGIVVNGNGNIIKFNDIISVKEGVENQGSDYVDARYNWWGSCEEPVSRTSGNVNYSSWLGVCIKQPSISKSCIFPYDDVILYANVSAAFCAENVRFEVNADGTWKNFTASVLNSGKGNYSAFIDKTNFNGGENVLWKVFADDCYGHLSSILGDDFYVNKRASLTASPLNPDGLGGWYITEPFFSLSSSDAGEIFYRWDNSGELNFTSPFNLTNIPNQPSESAGILELNWWGNFSCGKEKEQKKLFKIDLTSPVIKNLVPANKTTIFIKRPLIQAYLDEIYAGNSGIDKTSIIMKVNGQEVIKNIINADSLDAVVKYTPQEDLLDGLNTVYVNVSDKAGRNSELTWIFYINTSSLSDFNISVYSPENQKIYGKKDIDFNVSSTNILEKLEYINLNEKKPRWKTLCSRCREYGNLKKRRIFLGEGENNITIRGTDFFKNQKEINLMFIVDSVNPKISLIKPGKNSYFNGSSFYIKYSEDNLKNMTLVYGRGSDMQSISKDNCESGKNKECIFDANLTYYDTQEIMFWFEVSDIARTISSKIIKIKIDATPPALNITGPFNITYPSSQKGNIPFIIASSENVKLDYYDKSELLPKWKILCANCNKYLRIKKFYFGEHDIIIRAADNAGNSAQENIKFRVA